MFYNANGKLENKENKEREHFRITDVGYRDTKFINDDKSDPLYNKYYTDKKNIESQGELKNIYSNDGNIGIGNKNPIGTLTIGDSSKTSDGNLVIGKKSGMQSKHFKTGFDSNFWYNIGDYGSSNKASRWKKPFRIKHDAPDDSLTISNRGLVGIGTSNPYAKLTVNSYIDSQIQRLRNKQGYYDVDIKKNIFNEKNVLFTTDTKKFNFQKPVSTSQIRLESEKNNGEPEIRMFANNGKKQLNSVNLKAKKATVSGETSTNLYLGRNIKQTGKDVDHLVYNAQGHIGIGNLNPQAPLHIESKTNNGGDNGVRIKAGGPYTSHIKYGPKNDWYIRSGHADGKVIIQDTGGNVGIGTSNPLTKLHVSGDTALQGQTFANNITLKNDGTNWYHRANGDAAIVNSNNYDTLMMVGRGGGKRKIGMWDEVTINGDIKVTGQTCMNNVCITGNDISNLSSSVKNIAGKMSKFGKGTHKYQPLSDNGWGSAKRALCPAGHYQCGTWIRHEGKQGGGDDTGVNGLGIYCCSFF